MANLTPGGTSSNLIVNGDAESSSRNFPTYGWRKINGNVEWGAFTKVENGGVFGSKLTKPYSGSYMFSPMDGNNGSGWLNNLITNIPSAPTHNLNNMPGIIPGGYTPGNVPPNHVLPCNPIGMPVLTGLPEMAQFPGKKIPGVPTMNGMPMPGITGIGGIPSLPGMPSFTSPNGFFLLGLPGIKEIVEVLSFFKKFFGNIGEAETTLVQEIDVSLWKNYIEAGVQTFDFSGMYCSDGGNHYAQLAVAAYDKRINFNSQEDITKRFVGSEKALGYMLTQEYHGASWLKHSSNTLTLHTMVPSPYMPGTMIRETTTYLPKNTKYIYVYLKVWKNLGCGNYAGFFDDLKLTMPIYKIPFTISATTVQVGSTVKITPSITMNGITYTSLNPNIATVDANGNVKGISPGTAKIRVTDNVFKELDNTVTVTVTGVAPTITSHPANMTLNVGSNNSFIVNASGNPAPTYQWQYSTDGGASWATVPNSASYSGATTNMLNIINATLGLNNYRYRCAVTNAVSTVYSNAATLTVTGVAPTITAHPSNKVVTAGQSASFSGGATGNPAPTYQWQVSTNGGSSWATVPNAAPYSGVTTQNLTITNAPITYNDYRYRLAATNTVNTAYTNAAILTVQAATTIPVISLQPVNATVIAGQNASFSGGATGNPAPTYQWQCSTNNGMSWSALVSNDSRFSDVNTGKLILNNVSISLHGCWFRCEIKNSAGTAYTNAAILTVQAAPTTSTAPVVTSQPGNATANAGQSAVFKVAVTGDAPTYQWQFSTNGTTWMNMINIVPYSGVTTNQLNIANLIVELSGYRFRCIIINSTGAVASNAAILTVQQAQTPPPQTGNTIFKKAETVSCDGIYQNSALSFSTTLTKLNREHFKISTDFLVKEFREHWALVLSYGWRILGIKLKANGKISITTNNQENEYDDTGLSYQLNEWNQISVEHQNGSMRINNGNWFNVKLYLTGGDDGLYSTNYSNGVAFKGDLRNIEVVSY
jgi:hypothetical protein